MVIIHGVGGDRLRPGLISPIVCLYHGDNVATWDIVVLEVSADTGSCQKINNVPRLYSLEGEHGGMHCISKSNPAMVAKSHGPLK